MSVDIIHGDSREKLRELEADSIDAVVTDPPYALVSITKRWGPGCAAPYKEDNPYMRGSTRGFMGKQWDTGETAFDPAFWVEVLRVMKPGAHLIAFGGTRTYHRLVCAIEDAGFEVRDQIAWVFGSGFPKSHDVSKGVDKARRRDFVQSAIDLGVSLPGRSVDDWTHEDHAPGDKWWAAFKAALPTETWAAIERRVIGSTVSGATAWFAHGQGDVTAPATDAAKQWQGWGSALKPAFEPILLARKPLIGTIAQNVLAHGTGALNVDGCRVEAGDGYTENAVTQGINTAQTSYAPAAVRRTFAPSQSGRWPANFIHDGSEEVLAGFPASDGQQRAVTGAERAHRTVNAYGVFNGSRTSAEPRGDSGSAARFFYTAKADKLDRALSKHPTVKPVDLIAYLMRLVTPPGGTVLDPFAGSGTAGVAAMREGFNAVLIEREDEYVRDIRRRIAMRTGIGVQEFEKDIPRETVGGLEQRSLFDGADL